MAESAVRHQAADDPLTRLAHRVLILDRVHACLARVRRRQPRSALIPIDIDHFKPVTDLRGHPVGDEFAMLFEGAVKQPHAISTGGTSWIVAIGASVGIAHHPENGTDTDTLIIAADTAMYPAKNAGCNRRVPA